MSIVPSNTEQYTDEVFNQRLSERDWSDVLECNDVDKAWDLFKQRFIAVLDKVTFYVFSPQNIDRSN